MNKIECWIYPKGTDDPAIIITNLKNDTVSYRPGGSDNRLPVIKECKIQNSALRYPEHIILEIHDNS